MKKRLLLLVLALGICSIYGSAQTKKPVRSTTGQKKTSSKQKPKDSREYIVETNGFEWYKICKNGKYGAEDRNGNILVPNEFDMVAYNISAAVAGHPSGFFARKGTYEGWYDYDGQCVIPYTRHYTTISKEDGKNLGIYYNCDKGNEVIICDINGKEVCSITLDRNKYKYAFPRYDNKLQLFYFHLVTYDELYAIADGNGNVVWGPGEAVTIYSCESLVSTKNNPLANNPSTRTLNTNTTSDKPSSSGGVGSISGGVYPVQPINPMGGGYNPIGGSTGGGSVGGRSSGSGHRCNLCKGTGRKVRESWSGDKTSTKWCNECNKSVGMGHSHTNCDLCGGDGWCD